MSAATVISRGLAAFGALACGLAVALSAYASHALEGQAAHRVGLAALFAFGHGLALLLLAPTAGRWRLAALLVSCVGLLLFAGSLLGAALWAAPTTLAPAGGLLLMLGWLMIAGDALRR